MWKGTAEMTPTEALGRGLRAALDRDEAKKKPYRTAAGHSASARRSFRAFEFRRDGELQVAEITAGRARGEVFDLPDDVRWAGPGE